MPHEGLRPLFARNRLAVQSLESRLVVERIEVAEPALQENLNGPSRLGRMVGRRFGRFSPDRFGEAIARSQGRERDAPQPRAKLPQPIAPRNDGFRIE
jgi:hypothetical protein